MRETLDFLLFDWLKAGDLTARERFAEHSAETFGAVLDTCEKIAREKFAPFNRLADTQEPHFDGERVHLPQATNDAALAYAESGMLAAAQEVEKLALLVSGEGIDEDDVIDAVRDSARFDVFQLADAVVAGDLPRALRIVRGLRE